MNTGQGTMRWLLSASASLALAAAPAARAQRSSSAADAPPGSRPITWAEVLRRQHARDYFGLRTRLATLVDSQTSPARFARAVVEQAFNRPAESNATVAALLDRARISDTLRAELLRLEMDNDLRLFAYADGRRAADSLLAHPRVLDAATRKDVANTRRILTALSATPAQTVESSGETLVQLHEGRLPIQLNDSARTYVFDTGANLSTIMRSEAVAVGLHILPAGLDVGTSTTTRVTADLAVADRLAIGQLVFRNVVFLVLDDSLLTFNNGAFRIPGIVGFPVIEQMGEVRFERGGRIAVPAQPPFRPEVNLALAQLTPLTQVKWRASTLVCSLDTGADETEFYSRFYDAHRRFIDSVSRPSVRKFGGAGGIQTTPIRVVPWLTFALGDTTARLDSAAVLTRSIARDARDNYRDCNVGHDVFDAFSSLILNFRDMAFVLR